MLCDGFWGHSWGWNIIWSPCFSPGMVKEFWFTLRSHAWRLVSIGIGGFRRTWENAWKSGAFCLDPVPINTGQECVAQYLLALRSLQFSFTFRQWSSCGHEPVQLICVFLAYKRKIGNTISVKTFVRQSLGLPDLLHKNAQPYCKQHAVINTILTVF